ncbi:MAG: hypothetical protein KGH99_02120, partial [Thaumarchaeota archaeon]|nr:hypothetical protein [Nitrososphaerota archaeon]
MFEFLHKPTTGKNKQPKERKPLPMCVFCETRITSLPYKVLYFEMEDGQVIRLNIHNTESCSQLSQIKR